MADDDAGHGHHRSLSRADGSVADASPVTRWSATALASLNKWPWLRKPMEPLDFDPGPGRRSGFGSLTVLPYVVKSLQAKLRPDGPPEEAD